MYFVDTAEGVIRRFRIDGEFRTLKEISALAGEDVAPGKPDGATVDSEGCYWSARVWGGCLVRIHPNGHVLQRVNIPVKGPTCVALGAVGLTRLFATTLRINRTSEELASMPEAGGLFAIEVKVPGESQRLCALQVAHRGPLPCSETSTIAARNRWRRQMPSRFVAINVRLAQVEELRVVQKRRFELTKPVHTLVDRP
jgi:hypothetical protein